MGIKIASRNASTSDRMKRLVLSRRRLQAASGLTR